MIDIDIDIHIYIGYSYYTIIIRHLKSASMASLIPQLVLWLRWVHWVHEWEWVWMWKSVVGVSVVGESVKGEEGERMGMGRMRRRRIDWVSTDYLRIRSSSVGETWVFMD